ncbi:MAG: T9SS type A sorting domain-containing protein [Candidatus Latescibacteria bacterium]|nr:T9SS type A sorting domain-containing protein [Candidatus Latescibacterota bacterium]
MCKQDLKILLRYLLLYFMWMILLFVVKKAYSEDISNNWEFYEIPDRAPKQIAIDHENRKWVVMAIGVQVFDGENWIKYTQKNSGLPYYGINCLKLGRDNNMWFGTDKGAARFDGETWEVFDTENSGITADRVVDLAFDNDGGIWFTSGKTISYYNGTVWNTYADINYPFGVVNSIAIDSDNSSWFGTSEGGLMSFDTRLRWMYTTNNSGILSNNITTIAVVPNKDRLIITTMRGICEFDRLQWKSLTSKEKNISGGDVLAIDFDSNGLTWIGTEYGFSCYDGETWAYFPIYDTPMGEDDPKGRNRVRDLAIDKYDTIWLLTNIGLYRYTPQFVQITESFEDEIYHPGDSIELPWLTYSVRDVKIEYAINDKDTWQKIKSSLDADLKKYVYTIPSDIIPQENYSMKMTIRISSVDSPEISDEIFFHVEEKNLRESFVTFTPENSGIISKQASIIYEDRNGVMWFVSGICVSRYDGSDWEAFTTENSGLISGDISSIYEDINGKIWFLSNEGVSSFDGITWTTFKQENSGLISNYVNHMASTPDGSLWFGTNDGLSQYKGGSWETWFGGESIMYLAVGRNGRVFTLFHRFESETGKVACKWHSPHEWEIVSFDGEKWVGETKEYSTINVIGTDPDGFLWFNTFENKMIKYDGISWSINECPPEVFWVKKTGIEGCITWGSDGTIWIDDNKSLYSYDGKKWNNYSYTDSFSPGYIAAAPDGSLFCATYHDGFAIFDDRYWKTYLYEYGCPFYGIRTIFVDSHNVKWISSYDGIVRFDDGAANMVNVEERPEEITLLRNYPNPFNSSTTLSFSLPSSGFTELVIYNIMGQKIRTLLAEHQLAGKYSVVWNGRDEIGKSVSSGVYISRLVAGGTVCNGRMLLVK